MEQPLQKTVSSTNSSELQSNGHLTRISSRLNSESVLVEFSYAKDLSFNECGSVGQYVQARGSQLILLAEDDLEDLKILKKLEIVAMDDSEHENIYATIEMKVIRDPSAIAAFKTLEQFTSLNSEDIYDQLKEQITEALEEDNFEKLITFESEELESRALKPISPAWIQIPTEIMRRLQEHYGKNDDADQSIRGAVETWRRNAGIIYAVLGSYFINIEGAKFVPSLGHDSGFIWTRKIGKRKIEAHFTLFTEAGWEPEEYDVEYQARVILTLSRKDKELTKYAIYLSDLKSFLRRYAELKDFDKIHSILKLIHHTFYY